MLNHVILALDYLIKYDCLCMTIDVTILTNVLNLPSHINILRVFQVVNAYDLMPLVERKP